MDKIRVLHCLIGSMNTGGIETALMEVYRNIDRIKFCFDFVVHEKNQNVYEKEINMLGGVLYRVDFFSKHPFRHVRQFNKLLKEHTEYQIIHIHTTYSIMLPDAVIGKLRGRKIIIHSHNADAALKRKLVHKLLKNPFDALADYRVACSDLAAKWMFKKKYRNDVFYWYNAIDVLRFRFQHEIRENVRRKYGATDKFVIGNIGRLSYQKNQTFLLNLFAKIQEKCDNAVLWLVGDGEDRAMLEQRAADLYIQNKVMFMGNQTKVEDYMFAMDVYVCTSRYEGLAVSLVEAQTTGLPVIVKKQKISSMTKVIDDYVIVDENAALSQWLEEVLKYQNYSTDRENAFEQVSDSKFNIDVWIKYVEAFYQRAAKK